MNARKKKIVAKKIRLDKIFVPFVQSMKEKFLNHFYIFKIISIKFQMLSISFYLFENLFTLAYLVEK